MTNVVLLKKLDPKLYEELLNYESSIYRTMDQKTRQISKVRDFLLDGDRKAAWLLFRELKNNQKKEKKKKPRA